MEVTGHGKIKLQVITPEKVALEKEVDFVALPAVNGEMGVLHGHIPYLTQLVPGALRARTGDVQELFAVSGGFAEIKRDSVSVFAETAELAGEIDAERARQAAEKAQALKKTAGSDDVTLAQAELAIARAMVRVRVSEYQRRKTIQH